MNPLVGIIMGSESDLEIMKGAAEMLRQFEVEPELTIVSAHRTPDRLREYASTAKKRGIKVLIAGAGGAAHLPGMVAAQTILPVIGVPVRSSNSLEGNRSMNDAALKFETRDIVVDEVFPHSPETIWKTLTTANLMGRWLMIPAGFEPVEGKHFTYQTTPAGAWDGTAPPAAADAPRPQWP